ncbi:Protein ECERIFERUM 2 [Bienertia sinuspersici]
MVEKLVSDMRLSSIVPGKITGENKTYELKGIDLAMKLHYINALYFFNNTNIINATSIEPEINNNSNSNNNGCKRILMSVDEMKAAPMYDWLISYFMTCGRIRVSSEETGDRPSIKLNDAGIRMIEAHSIKTVDEWLAMEDFLGLQDHLVYNHALGPDLPFSPLVCLQHPKTLSLQDPLQKPNHQPSSPAQEPMSVKRVNPVGNHWVIPTNCKIGTHTFHLTSKQLDELRSKVYGSNNISDDVTGQSFELITAILWRSIAKVRKDLGTKYVTICKPKTINRQKEIPYNGQVLGTIEANFPVSSANPLKLVHKIAGDVVDESDMIEELVNKESSNFDYIVYGTNLTFVDMENADVYGFKLKGNSPAFVSYTIGGVQDRGAILVLPGPNKVKDEDNKGKLIVLHLPEIEIEFLKSELKKEWSIT